MAVPSSGAITMRSIKDELENNNYDGSATFSNISSIEGKGIYLAVSSKIFRAAKSELVPSGPRKKIFISGL